MPNLNLLPPEQRQRLRAYAQARAVTRMFVSLTVMVLAACGALLAIRIVLLQRQSDVRQQLSQSQIVTPSGKALPVAETIHDMNARLKVLRPLTTSTTINLLLESVVLQVPAGVTLSSLSYASTTRKLSLHGTAASRNDIPAFQKNLEQVSGLTEISIKSDLNERTDIPLSVTASVGTQP